MKTMKTFDAIKSVVFLRLDTQSFKLPYLSRFTQIHGLGSCLVDGQWRLSDGFSAEVG